MSLGEMCSFFYQAMETSTVQGDLSDVILRAGGGGGFLPSTSDETAMDLVNKDFEELTATAAPAAAAPLVSAPRAPGVKRRKGQAKRVICIPAPSTGDQESSSNKTHGGVVVPSDLWAWRKYGQKPIKGSPYPRGYYRCSSSKGCSARKQVERSRSDPNMLVITYTSDHNHPWPTHRNSLAGSTRSQPSKTTHNTSKNSSSTDSSHYNQVSPSSSKQEQEDMFLTSVSSPLEVIKEENPDPDQFFDESCKDMGFFDELGGLEPDPMSFFFTSPRDQNKGLEPLSFFDWDGN